jgi:hypothetical protein
MALAELGENEEPVIRFAFEAEMREREFPHPIADRHERTAVPVELEGPWGGTWGVAICLLLLVQPHRTRSRIIFAAMTHNRTPMVYLSCLLDSRVVIKCEPITEPTAAIAAMMPRKSGSSPPRVA